MSSKSHSKRSLPSIGADRVWEHIARPDRPPNIHCLPSVSIPSSHSATPAPPRPLLSAATPRGAPTCPLSGLPRRRRSSRPPQKPDPDLREVRWDPASLLPPPSTARSAHLTTPLDHLRSPRPALDTAAAAVVVLELKPPSFARLRVVPLPDLGCFWSIALVLEWLP